MYSYSDKPIGQLQSILSPYFPQWHQNLTTVEHEFRDGTYIFKVSLPHVWRRIAIPAKMSLDNLSSVILNGFEFGFDHLYEFFFKTRYGLMKEIFHPYMEEKEHLATEFLIGDLPLEPGASMTYLYDFGDNWEFNVKLERIDPVDPQIQKPVIIESHGEAPEQYYYGDEE